MYMLCQAIMFGGAGQWSSLLYKMIIPENKT